MSSSGCTYLLDFIKKNPSLSSTEIHSRLQSGNAFATTKRHLTQLLADKLIISEGKGKATKYKLSPSYQLFYPVDINDYFKQEIDERQITGGFNFSLINKVLSEVSLFSEKELIHLNELQLSFQNAISKLTSAEYQSDLEKLAIDLSWKSSQIEGNTYSLLETERLLKEKETASGHTKDEAVMLLNHKDALDFIFQHPDYLTPLTLAKIEDIHRILIKELKVDKNIRTRKVGITGTNYLPLDNEFQLREALQDMCRLINNKTDVFEKSLLAVLLLSYIQAFNDGNKRTARIVGNAILLANGYCPISFRTIDSIEYKKAMLLFYEQNNITAFKKIFIEQFEFAVKTYF